MRSAPEQRSVFSHGRTTLGRTRDAIDAFASNYPARFAIAIFVVINFLFAVLFMLPITTTGGRPPLSPVDAIFMAVSVVCVTGLSTVDVAHDFSPFGHSLMLLGVQVGGIGVLTLASILGLTVARKLGLKQRLLAASDTNPSRVRKGVIKEGQAIRLGEVGGLLTTVAVSVLVFEAILWALIFPRLVIAGEGLLEAARNAVAWSFMSFTNTGFVLTPEGITPYATDPYMLLVLSFGVFVGALGFPVYFVLLRNLKDVRHWSLHVKLTIAASVTLLLLGILAYLVLESDNPNTMGDMDWGQRLLQSTFLSAMSRSGGFSTLDLAELNHSSLLVTDMMMFIGGGSASTAGGVKVTTLAVLFLAAIAEAKGKSSMEAFGRRIPSDILRLAVSVVLWGATLVAISTVLILQITKEPLDYVLFDVISAFATCGLSTGLTGPDLEPAAKAVLAVTMLFGRIGSVTLAAALAASQRVQLLLVQKRGPSLVDKIAHDAPVLVIGLGRFGAATAGQLSRLDREVLAIDSDMNLVQKWSERVTHAVQADARNIDALRQVGAQDFSIAVCAVGSSIEASVLVVANLVDLKIPQIWAKAISQSHGKILSRIGANHVIYPEAEAGERVAHLVSGRMIDYIEFDDDFAIVKMYPPRSLRGVPLADSKIRSRFNLTVVGVKSPGGEFTYATPETVISNHDLILVSGHQADIERFAAIGT